MARMTPRKQPSLNSQLAKVVNTFGADIIMRLADPEPTTWKQQMMVNASLMNDYDNATLYDFAPVVPGKVTVLWMEAQPHPTKDARGVLRRALLGARLGPELVSHVWALPEGRIGPDLPLRIARYLPWTMDALKAAGNRHVLLVGRAAWLWRADLKPADCVGKWYVWKGKYMVMCVGDPMHGHDKQDVDRWHRHMAAFTAGVNEYVGLEAVQARSCHACTAGTAGVYVYDPDGVPYCRDHAKQGMLDYETEAKKWNKQIKQASQETML